MITGVTVAAWSWKLCLKMKQHSTFTVLCYFPLQWCLSILKQLQKYSGSISSDMMQKLIKQLFFLCKSIVSWNYYFFLIFFFKFGYSLSIFHLHLHLTLKIFQSINTYFKQCLKKQKTFTYLKLNSKDNHILHFIIEVDRFPTSLMKITETM